MRLMSPNHFQAKRLVSLSFRNQMIGFKDVLNDVNFNREVNFAIHIDNYRYKIFSIATGNQAVYIWWLDDPYNDNPDFTLNVGLHLLCAGRVIYKWQPFPLWKNKQIAFSKMQIIDVLLCYISDLMLKMLWFYLDPFASG